jgi:hypothetical protein
MRTHVVVLLTAIYFLLVTIPAAYAQQRQQQGTPGILRCALSGGMDLHATRDPSSPVVTKIKCGDPVLLIDQLGATHLRTEDGKDGFILGANFGQWGIEPKTAAVIPSVNVTPSVTTRDTRIETPVAAPTAAPVVPPVSAAPSVTTRDTRIETRIESPVAAPTVTAPDKVNHPTPASPPAQAVRAVPLLQPNSIVATSGVRVYVFTQEKEGGFTDAESKRRTDSVNDIRKALAKRKGFALVDTPDAAQVILEVTVSGEVETDPIAQSRRTQDIADVILGTSHVETKTVRQTKSTLVTALRIPGSAYTVNFAYQGGFWAFMADRIVDQFDKWVQMNRARLQAR